MIVCLLLKTTSCLTTFTTTDLETVQRLLGGAKKPQRDASDDHDPIYDLIAKRNLFHGMAVYQKRDDNDHENDLMQEWLRRKMTSKNLKPFFIRKSNKN